MQETWVRSPGQEDSLHPQVFLRKGVTASRCYEEQTGKSGSFGLWHHPRGYVSNFLVRTIALISHTSKVMLKILQARLQQYVNCEIP